MVKNTVTNKLSIYLALSGLTQCELASKAGVTAASIARWVSGIRTPSVYNAIKVADVLGVSVTDIWG